jgi:hypothetical protein
MNGFHMNQTQSYKGWHNLNLAYQDLINNNNNNNNNSDM